jgi:hypothetical protein
MSIWDLIYEHCQYFSAGSFVELTRRAGLADVHVAETFGGQFLSLETGAGTYHRAESEASTEGDGAIHKLAASFQDRFSAMIDRWQQALEELSPRGPTVVWGAGSKGVTFTNLMDIDSIVGLVDINPNKHNRFIAGTGHRIFGPMELRDLKPSSILVMNPLYKDEVGRQVQSMGLNADVRVVD